MGVFFVHISAVATFFRCNQLQDSPAKVENPPGDRTTSSWGDTVLSGGVDNMLVRSDAPLRGLKVRPEAKVASNAGQVEAQQKWEATVMSGAVDSMMERSSPLKGLKMRVESSGASSNSDDSHGDGEEEEVEDLLKAKNKSVKPKQNASIPAAAGDSAVPSAVGLAVDGESGGSDGGDVDDDEEDDDDDEDDGGELDDWTKPDLQGARDEFGDAEMLKVILTPHAHTCQPAIVRGALHPFHSHCCREPAWTRLSRAKTASAGCRCVDLP